MKTIRKVAGAFVYPEKLFDAVDHFGGFEKVVNSKLWQPVRNV